MKLHSMLYFFSIFPITAFYLMEFYEHNPFEEVRFMAAFFNIILFELIAWILYFVTGRGEMGTSCSFYRGHGFGLINHYVMLFRSTPFCSVGYFFNWYGDKCCIQL